MKVQCFRQQKKHVTKMGFEYPQMKIAIDLLHAVIQSCLLLQCVSEYSPNKVKLKLSASGKPIGLDS